MGKIISIQDRGKEAILKALEECIEDLKDNNEYKRGIIVLFDDDKDTFTIQPYFAGIKRYSEVIAVLEVLKILTIDEMGF